MLPSTGNTNKDSLVLKTTSSGEEVVMYGFEYEDNLHIKAGMLAALNSDGNFKEIVLFSGSKEELLSKEDKFFQEIVKWERYETGEEIYKNYSSDISINFLYPDESIQSALFCLTHNKYILIIKRTT